jgi:hypothetical protein
MRLSYLDPHVDKSFWDPLHEQVKDMPEPPANLFALMPTKLASVPSNDDVAERLKHALNEKTDYDDTHPCLTDRLTALNQLPSDPEKAVQDLLMPKEQSAAEAFFGAGLSDILAKLGNEYRPKIAKMWVKEHNSLAKSEKMLEMLQFLEEPTEEQEVRRAGLIYRLKGADEAEPGIRALVEKFPENAAPKFWLGSILLDRDDPNGIPLLKEAMNLDRSCRQEAINAIGKYYYTHGQKEELEALKAEAVTAYAEAAVAEQASWRIKLADDLRDPGLLPAEVEKMRNALAPIQKLAVAYVVKRLLPGTGEEVYCLLVFPKRVMIEQGSEGSKLVSEVAKMAKFPFAAKIFSPSPAKDWIKRLDGIAGAKVYEAPKKK